jgi:hypothetical protein
MSSMTCGEKFYFAAVGVPAHGPGSLVLAQQKTWTEASIAVRAVRVFTSGVLLASLVHRNLLP